ncbi:MAG: 5-deoxy-glucuronate isomerase [Alphaproteobacteria bacterium]|jgi:5-deoxy-glucuronate isomerase|nr:5-deoxy-glucuronate isomerase [Alphaproteobacteria bacterium]
MYFPPFDNQNQPIIAANHPQVPLVYFNIVKLKQNEQFTYAVPGYETCIVPATGLVDVLTGSLTVEKLGGRGVDVWDGEPEGVYIPSGAEATIACRSEAAEIFIAGARFEEVLSPFAVRADNLDLVQYGSDETKTHRKIKHILGQKQAGQVGRLLVSELFTVGAGGWSGFPPHKHDTDRLPDESRHDEVYNFRFRPEHGFGLQLLQPADGTLGKAFHLVNGSSFAIPAGYHPCVAAPGYEMYYFTILGGLSQRPLVQFFQPEHAWQIETIPGIKDMIAKFK